MKFPSRTTEKSSYLLPTRTPESTTNSDTKRVDGFIFQTVNTNRFKKLNGSEALEDGKVLNEVDESSESSEESTENEGENISEEKEDKKEKNKNITEEKDLSESEAANTKDDFEKKDNGGINVDIKDENVDNEDLNVENEDESVVDEAPKDESNVKIPSAQNKNKNSNQPRNMEISTLMRLLCNLKLPYFYNLQL